MPPLPISSQGLGHSTAEAIQQRPNACREQLPLLTLLPRAWHAFGLAPWRSVGLAALVLLSGAGLAVIGQDLRQIDATAVVRLGDLMVFFSLVLPLLPLLALLQLADELLSSSKPDSRPPARWSWLVRQSLALVLLETVVVLGGVAVIQGFSWMLGRISTTLAGMSVLIGAMLLLSWMFSQVLALPLLVHHRHRALQAMDHSRQIVRSNGLKMLAILGLLSGLNLLGLIGATLGLLLTLPFSALLLMACCRTQTPCSSDSRRNMLPT